MIEVAEMGGVVEWGVAVVGFYGGEEFSSDPRYLIEVAVPGGVA